VSCGRGEAFLSSDLNTPFLGFTDAFYEAYHRVHPRSQPHYPERQKLYELYHHLNVSIVSTVDDSALMFIRVD
jgi:protein-ribulosamine 3-kinase